MTQVLSQDEIDALLKGMSGGEIETEQEVAESQDGIITYELTNQEKIIRGRMPTLEIINQRFSRLFRGTISNMLRKVVDISALSLDTIKFGEFLKSLPVPASLHLFRMNPLKGFSLIVIESKLVFALIDIFFGGEGSSSLKVEGRDFTVIEDRIIKRVILAALQDYSESWKPVYPVVFEYSRSEMNPQFATIVPPSDVVIVTSFEIEIEQVSGNITICIPYANIEPIRDKLYAGFQTERLEVDANWIKRLKKIITTLEVNSIVTLGEVDITIGKILQLKEGDIINLEKKSTSPLILEVEGIPKFKGFAGILNSNKALKIVDKIYKQEF